MIPGVAAYLLISARLAATDDRTGISLGDSMQWLIALGIFVGVGLPACYLLRYGIRFGPAAAAARRKGWVTMLIGLGLGVLGLGAMGLVAYFALEFGVILICWGLLVPFAWVIVGLMNLLTGVDIVSANEENSGKGWFSSDSV